MRELSHPTKRHPVYLSAGELRALSNKLLEGLGVSLTDPLLAEAVRRVRQKVDYLDHLPILQRLSCQDESPSSLF